MTATTERGAELRTSRTVLMLCIAELFCLGATFSGTLIGLPIVIDEIDTSLERETVLGIALASGAAMAIVAGPLFGWLSDRTVVRHGHRGRWILGGAALGTLAMAFTGTATSVPALAFGWVLTQTAYAACLAGLYGALTDVTDQAGRIAAAGWFAAAATGSLVLGAGGAGALPKEPALLFTVLPTMGVVAAWAAARQLRRTPRRHTATDGVELEKPAAADFWRLWRQRLISQCAWGFTTVFGVHLLVRRTGIGTDQAATVTGIAGALSALMAVLTAVVVAAALARRIGYRGSIGVGLVLVLVANVCLAFTTSTELFLVGCVLSGAGVGIYTALDLVLVMRILRPGSEGRYLGLFSAARTLPQSLVPAVAPLVLAIGAGDLVGADRTQNYFAFFTLGVGLTVVAIAMVPSLPAPGRNEAEATT